jgi:hypothetical protein
MICGSRCWPWREALTAPALPQALKLDPKIEAGPMMLSLTDRDAAVYFSVAARLL